MPKHRASVHEKIPAGHPTGRLAQSVPRTDIGLERIIFFSDAVIAIAITLLALQIRLPDGAIPASGLPAALWALTPQLIGFVISFFVVGVFWISHHRLFEYIRTYNRGLMWINLVFLFLVAIIPFPTAVIGRFPAVLPSVVLYASVVVCLSLVRVWFWWYVCYRAHLVDPGLDPRLKRYELVRPFWTAGVFGISILIAFWNPAWAMNFWLVLIPITLFTRYPM